MKLPPHLLARLASALAALGTGTAFADLPAAPLRESEQKQSQIQGETRVLGEILDAMLGEYERNNLTGDDSKAVRRVRESLGSLSATEMRQVVDMLQRARAATNPDAAVKTVADAFTAQKQIVVAIQRILAEHLREQETADISRQLHDLADRQAANLRNGIELARMNNGVQFETSGAVERAQLETQRAEQAAIADELKMIRGKIARIAANPENAGTAKTFTDAARQIEQVEPVAAAAAEALKAGQVFKAAADEKASRDELRKIARQLAAREQGPEALRKAERELGEVIAEQRAMRDSTAIQRKQADFEKWLADKLAANDRNDALPQRLRNQPASELRKNPEIQGRFEAEQKEKDAQLRKLEDQQGELADRTDALAEKTTEVPNVATGLKDAVAKMQEARADMQDANAPQAAQQQDAALAKLSAAQAELKRRAEEAEARAAQQMAQNAPAQPNNPANAAQMAEAMNQLAQAQQQIEKAQANLQEAAEQSGQQPAQDAAQAAQQAAAQPAQAAVNSAQGAAQQSNASASMQQAAQQLAQASKSAAQAASQSGAQPSPTAQQAMQQAARQLSSATTQAAGGQNSAAQQSAQSASQSLAQAQATMAAQQAGLSPSQSGAPMPGGQGQGKGQSAQPGQGPGKSSQASNGPSQGAETYTPGDPKAVERGAREAALKKADFIGLPARERAAIEQSLREKYPQEYGALVEQYLLNLANESAKK